MEIAQVPTPEQIEELLKGPADTPVVMVNLLKFKERADVDGEDISGEDSYLRYGAEVRKLVEGLGGRFIWSGRVDSQVLGKSDVDFDVIALVEYPSREAFLKMAQSPEMAAISGHRSAGLEGQWLIATTASPLG
jgi:uncharacterized protein (DUF1330 family)